MGWVTKGFVITAKRHVIAKWCPVLRGCCSSLGSEACPKRRAHWSGSAKHAAAQDRAGNCRHGLPFVVLSIGGRRFSNYLCSMLMSHVSGFQHLDEPGRTLCSNSQRPRADMYIPRITQLCRQRISAVCNMRNRSLRICSQGSVKALTADLWPNPEPTLTPHRGPY